jgi:hypothetical protein
VNEVEKRVFSEQLHYRRVFRVEVVVEPLEQLLGGLDHQIFFCFLHALLLRLLIIELVRFWPNFRFPEYTVDEGGYRWVLLAAVSIFFIEIEVIIRKQLFLAFFRVNLLNVTGDKMSNVFCFLVDYSIFMCVAFVLA